MVPHKRPTASLSYDRPGGVWLDQQRAVPSFTSAQGYVIDTQHAWGGHCPVLDGAQQSQQRIGTDRYAGLTCQPCSTFATSLQSKRLQQIVGNDSAACISSQCTVEAFGEDLPRTSWLIAEPPTRAYVQVNNGPAPG